MGLSKGLGSNRYKITYLNMGSPLLNGGIQRFGLAAGSGWQGGTELEK
jgi:hypothetical protein